MKVMCDKGWTWTVVPAPVEKQWPQLPSLAQQALNASNNVITETSELETASTISDAAANAEKQNLAEDWGQYVEQARASAPPCEPYIETIGKYVRDFSGGPGAPLIHYLDYVGKAYGANKKLGKDFFEAITNLQVPSDTTKYPFLRTACICCNLVSTKVQDGIARFITPAQVERLKAKAWKGRVDEAESALAHQWMRTTLKINTGNLERLDGYKFYGAFSARVCTYVMQTGKSGFEGVDYKSIEDLVEAFECKIGNSHREETTIEPDAEAPASSGSSKMATSAEVSDPRWIAQQRGYVVGKHYSMKGNPRIFHLEKMGASVVVFKEVLLRGEPIVIEVPFDEMKLWSEYKGNLPALITPSKAYGSTNLKVQAEMRRCMTFATIVDAAKDYREYEESLSYSLFPSVVCSTGEFAIGKFRLAPFTDSPSKLVPQKPGSLALVQHDGARYTIEPPPKPSVEDETKWAPTALLCGFFWVGTSTDASEVNVEIKMEKLKKIEIALLRNIKKIEAGDRLVRLIAKTEKEKVIPEKYKQVKSVAEENDEGVEADKGKGQTRPAKRAKTKAK